MLFLFLFFFFQAEDGIRDYKVTGVQTCALPIFRAALDEPEAVLVHVGPVAVDPDVGPARPVRLLVALRILPEALRHPRPWRRDDELADLSAHGPPVVAEAVGGHAGNGAVERARLDRRDRERAQDAA